MNACSPIKLNGKKCFSINLTLDVHLVTKRGVPPPPPFYIDQSKIHFAILKSWSE